MSSGPREIVIVAEDARMSGGAEKVALLSAKELALKGYKVSLFTAGESLDPTLSPDMFDEVVLLNRSPYWDDWFPASRPKKLKTLLAQPEPGDEFRRFLSFRDPASTIMHFHGFHTKLTTGVVAAALDLGFPTIITMHDFGLACPIATWYDYTENRLCTRVPLSLDCWKASCIAPDARALKILRACRTLGQRTVLKINRRLMHVATVSEFAGEKMRPYLDSDTKIHYLPNPIEATPSNAEPGHRGSIAEAMADDSANSRHILWVGRMTQEKDPVMAARAAKRAGVAIRFLGDGPLKDEIRSANPDAEVLGWASPERVRQETHTARALLLTSRWYETASLVTLDAMSLGTPPIVPRGTAATEWFTDGEEGWTFALADEDDLVRALEATKSDDSVARFGRSAYERYWSAPFTVERHLQALEAIYAEMLTG